MNELSEFERSMAENDVRLYADLVKGSRRTKRFDQVFFWWFLFFGTFEAILTVWYVVHLELWAISSFVIGGSQFAMAKLNRKTRKRHLESGEEWQRKYDAAVAKLESVDPTNALIPYVINEVDTP